ncbi:hypothetical protein DID88_008106 [Monilinia fructigena]|uniref:Cytochrome b5 heme-binding domain-containing protein n=1 Tax=Monilinia fructigena TaxID=38457 RepID=A0A395J5C2_9HELO|nr:hypothetical protein DID88_008106 [Monilinia fructigena]
MSETKEFTYAEQLPQHQKDLFMIIHDKVYDTSSFVDEHPGGEEVLLDVGGQDATEAFEDVGHSDEAREILDGLLVGTLKRLPGDPAPKAQTATAYQSSQSETGTGIGLYAIILIGGLAAFGAYKYLLTQEGASGGGVFSSGREKDEMCNLMMRHAYRFLRGVFNILRFVLRIQVMGCLGALRRPSSRPPLSYHTWREVAMDSS